MNKFLTPLLFFFCINVSAQINAGMPDIAEVVGTFYSRYSYPGTDGKYLRFEKRKAGWFITECETLSDVPVQPSFKFWDRAKGSYAQVPYGRRPLEDSAGASSEIASYKERFLGEFQLYFYRRILFYGYIGWDWDVIQELGEMKMMTDSLYESLGLASSHYAMGYAGVMVEPPFINGDRDRSITPYAQPIGRERANKLMHYMDQSIRAYAQLGKLNPSFKTLKNDARYSASIVKIEAYSTLQFLGYEDAAKKYLKEVTLPDSILGHAKQVLEALDSNSILLSDNFVESYALFYLQGTGMRKDVVSLYRPLLIQRRALLYLDHKYHGSLLGTDSSLYMKPEYAYAFFRPDLSDEHPVSLDIFLDRFAAADSTLEFFAKKVFIKIDKSQAEKLYGKADFRDRISVPIDKNYLIMDELIWMSIVNKNFLKRKIYYLFPYYNDLTNTGIKKKDLYWELTPL